MIKIVWVIMEMYAIKIKVETICFGGSLKWHFSKQIWVTTKMVRTALFWTQRVVVCHYRHIGTMYQSHQ